ncbi:FAD-binding monooxygenase [Microbacterium shaanxiense]
MQYYLNGFYTGDPSIAPAPMPAPASLPEDIDVLIVGSGPAGLVLAAQLARFPEITTRIAERRPGPLELGQADGIACRTVEMFEAFDLSDQLLKESYWVNETTFWRPSATDRRVIERTGRVQDTRDGMSEFPHVIVNQARVQDYLLGSMQRSATRLSPDYGLEFVGLDVDRGADRPVSVMLRETSTDAVRTVRAKYVVGCDGARSAVRTAIGHQLRGDAANHAWGVMDILPITDFPDIRLKSAIQSDAGSILLIPREGGHLVRLYVDLGTITAENRAQVRAMSADDILAVANDVLRPYTLEAAETAWFSVYEVAQRIADAFDDAAEGSDPRVFIAGDACHTHSAKAGQGMNVSMQDGFNLGWKLASVLGGFSESSLLASYSAERRPVAQELIDFDREWSALMASPAQDPDHPERGGITSEELEEYFVRAGDYTAGVATRYREGLLVADPSHQGLATGFPIGMRLHSAPVVRVADALQTELGHAAKADGRWRLYAFTDAEGSRMQALCEWLVRDGSPLRRYARPGADIDALIDVRAILQRPHREVDLGSLPALLAPRKGKYGLIDYEKVFTAAGTGGTDIFEARSVDRTLGCMVVVRPDQFVADVLPLDAVERLSAFFARVFTGHEAG